MGKMGLRQSAENLWNIVTRNKARNEANKNTAWLNLHLADVCPPQVRPSFTAFTLGLYHLSLCRSLRAFVSNGHHFHQN